MLAVLLAASAPREGLGRVLYPFALALIAVPFGAAGWLVGQVVPMHKTTFVPCWP